MIHLSWEILHYVPLKLCYEAVPACVGEQVSLAFKLAVLNCSSASKMTPIMTSEASSCWFKRESKFDYSTFPPETTAESFRGRGSVAPVTFDVFIWPRLTLATPFAWHIIVYEEENRGGL